MCFSIMSMIILEIVLFVALIFGTITDIKKREVNDWLNYSLLVAGLGIRLIYSIVNNDYWFFLYGLIGLAASFAISWIMFYTGQWGGGDSKLLIGMGAIIGIDFVGFPKLITFIVNMFIFGAIYGLLYSFYLGLRRYGEFKKELFKTYKKHGKAKYVFFGGFLTVGFIGIFMANIYLKYFMLTFSVIFLLTYFVWIAVKAVEKVSMYVLVDPKDLVEGDWIAKEVYVGKELVCGPKDLGIEKDQIEKLKKAYAKKQIGKIEVREGMPFVPSFLIGYFVTTIWGAWFFRII